MNNATKESVSFSTAVRLGIIATQANTVPMFWGPPGVGKTGGIAPAIADALGFKSNMNIIEIAHGDDAEIVGIRIIKDGKVMDAPLTQLRNVIEKPGLLVLDELNRSLPRQGLILPLLSQRRLGSWSLHNDSRIVCAGNYTTSAGAEPLISALANRLVHINVLPTLKEVQDYLLSLGKDGDALALAAEDYALTAERRPALIQLEPPPGAEDDGVTWASPRAVEGAVRLIAEADLLGSKSRVEPDELMALLTGVLGEVTATAYIAVRNLRKQLPSPKEIAASPAKVAVPSTPDLEVALLGILPQALSMDRGSWAYIARLSPEIRAVARRLWMTRYPGDTTASRKAMTEAVRV
ncbi:AAA [Caudoviricetes sp.]|nr:AAA [Caudoviricetes sp.]